MKHVTALLAALLGVALAAPTVLAFCGFYVAKADTKLFNQASQVVLVRHDDKTVLTMANDFRGDLKEFAIVVPVPTVLEKGQIRVSDRALIEHLDAYSAPRLVEYFDDDPCSPRYPATLPAPRGMTATRGDAAAERARGLGVTIEARYTVGEYDILILSARESGGLQAWLRDNGYRLPAGASSILGSYLKQGMKFFVARVNLAEQARLGFTYLRPLQMAFESPKFMLPIRLGTLNADGHQDLFVYALTRKGRVETTNYRTVRLPTGMELPVYVKEEFPQFYRAMFSHQVEREDMRAVFLEYAWDMGWCDRRLLAVGERRRRPPAAPAARRRGRRLRDAPARTVRRRALPRRPRLPGDRRPRQFPGPLRPAASVEGGGDVRGGGALPRLAARARGAGGRGAGVADRLAHRGDPPQGGRPSRRRRPHVVAEAVRPVVPGRARHGVA